MNCKSELYKIKYDKINNNYITIFKDIESNNLCEFHVCNTDAKNIALANEKIPSYRLKTHELILSLLHQLSIKIDKTIIYKKKGEICSDLFLLKDSKILKIHANFTDSIILCLHSFAIIHINDSLFNIENPLNLLHSDKQTDNNAQKIIKLNKTLNELIEKEHYESAAKIRDLISSVSNKK